MPAGALPGGGAVFGSVGAYADDGLAGVGHVSPVVCSPSGIPADGATGGVFRVAFANTKPASPPIARKATSHASERHPARIQ